jgi:signal transduction histidine kinase
VGDLVQFVLGFVFAVVVFLPVVYAWQRQRRRRARRRSETQGRQIEELSKLTGGLAHEIKNPLSTIKINLQLIGEDAASDRAQNQRWFRKIEVVRKETERLEQILEDFLRFIGKPELKLGAVDVNEVVGEMIDFYSPQAHAHNVALRQGLAAKSLLCRVDSDMLKQVVLNLFINAQQAMPDGGELIVRTDAQDAEAVIEISDTGPGISPQKLDKIFDAYYTTRPGGSGLGLPTARKIIEAHGGSIDANSQPGKGTSFTIQLPLEG